MVESSSSEVPGMEIGERATLLVDASGDTFGLRDDGVLGNGLGTPERRRDFDRDTSLLITNVFKLKIGHEIFRGDTRNAGLDESRRHRLRVVALAQHGILV